MTSVRCDREDCRRWLNGYCTLRKILIIKGKCQDYVKRKGQFRNTTTTVYCDAYNCKNRLGGMCMLSVVILKDGKCPMGIEAESENVRSKIQRHSR